MEKRNQYVIVGVIVMLLAGVVYAWPVLSEPIGREFAEISATKLSFTFTLCMISFCLGGILGGILQKRTSPKIILLASGILFALGFIASSRVKEISALYFTYGVLAGLASGLVYNTVMSVVISWFQDCQGLISGVLLMGFGFGSMILGYVYTACTQDQIGAWRNTFIEFGILIALVCCLSAIFLKKKPLQDGTNIEINDSNDDTPPFQMLTKGLFWLYFIWAVLLSAAGLALIAQAGSFAGIIADNYSSETIAFVVGLISIFNGVGRIFFGAVYDQIGRKKTMLLITIIFLVAAATLILAQLKCSFIFMIIAFIAAGFSYGGITPTNSAFVYSEYGQLHYSENLAFINLNLLFASFGGTISGYLYDYYGSFLSTFFAMLLAGTLSMFIVFLMDRTAKEK